MNLLGPEAGGLERFPAKWTSGSPQKTRQRNRLERVSDSEGTETALAEAIDQPQFRGRLFRKYVAFFAAVVCLALISYSAFDSWFYYQEYKNLLVRLQRAQAELEAAKISQVFEETEGQVAWTTQQPWPAGTLEEWRFDFVRLLRQVPAITELAKLDASGREQLRMSRLAPDVVGSQADFSREPKFLQAVANKAYYGPVYFGRDSVPHMTFAMADTSGDAGVTSPSSTSNSSRTSSRRSRSERAARPTSSTRRAA